MNADDNLQTAGAPLLHRDVTERIIGVFFEVYNELGFGFAEALYLEAMARALRNVGLEVERESPVTVYFRGLALGTLKPDLLVERAVVIELKAVRELQDWHTAQLLNYLRATSVEVGLLLNFGPKVSFKRLVFDNVRKKVRVHPR
jgi:GxxExxY protein